MSITLAFRTSFFVTAFLAVLYTRALVSSTAILAFTAYMFYGHPESNTVWQEALVFAWTWAAAVVVAWAVAPKTRPAWPVFYEVSMIRAQRRAKLTPTDGVVWVCALVVAIMSYAALELVGYDSGTFYRLQSFVWMLLLMLVVFVFDTVSGRKGTHFFPTDQQRRHVLALCVVGLALLIDIMVRDSTIYRFMLPALGSVLALAGLRWWVVSERDKGTPDPGHLKRS